MADIKFSTLFFFWIVRSVVGWTQSADAVLRVELKTAMETARRNYPSIREKLAQKEAAHYQTLATRTDYLPGIVVQGQILQGTSNQVRGAFFPNEGMAIPVSGGIKPDGYTSTATWGSYVTGFVNWKFFSFGKIKANVEVARAGEASADADYLNEVFQQQIKVGDAYFLALMGYDMLKSQRANLARVKALKDVTSAYTKNGLKPGVDSSLVNAEYSRATLQLLESERLANEQMVYLKELMGLGVDGAMRLDTTLYVGATPAAIPLSADYSANPELLFYKRLISLNEQRAIAIRRSQYPSISLIGASWARGSGISNTVAPNGDFMYNKSFGPGVALQPFLDWMVGVSTIWNVTSLVRTGDEARAQRQVAHMAEEKYNQETLRVQSQLERSRLRYNAAMEAARQAPIQLQAATDAYAQAKSRYEAGLNSILELTQTFALLNRAEVDASMAKGNVWRAIIEYAAVTGNINLLNP